MPLYILPCMQVVHELLDACRLLPLDGPPAPTWAEQYHHMRKPRNVDPAAGGDDKSAGATMTTMTATMTSAYVAKLAEELSRRNHEDNEGGDLVILPLRSV